MMPGWFQPMPKVASQRDEQPAYNIEDPEPETEVPEPARHRSGNPDRHDHQART
jgi:hypothetical protein